MSSSSPQAKPYFPNLDASRFMAFILVFMAHCFVTTDESIRSWNWFQAVSNYGKLGFLGLEYFFVLSSFLITYLVLFEYAQQGGFRIKHFLIRRSLRVWPLYFTVVFLGYGITYLATNVLGIAMETLPQLSYFLLFWVNFYALEYGTNFLFFLAFLWSISIEEQFYLCWAFVMKFYRKRLFPLLCIVLIAISLLYRLIYIDEPRALYFHTLSTVGNFGIGALAAYCAFYNTQLLHWFKQLPRSASLLFYFIFIASILGYHELRTFQGFVVVQRAYYSLLFAWFILEQSYTRNRLFNAGNLPFFSYLGKISYGLYCYHGIVITVLIKWLESSTYKESSLDVFGFFPFVIFALTVAVSALSYRYLETPFLNKKSRFNFTP
jgi:peptidoglycan/LPS O-acetylase OafA/YrhL